MKVFNDIFIPASYWGFAILAYCEDWVAFLKNGLNFAYTPNSKRVVIQSSRELRRWPRKAALSALQLQVARGCRVTLVFYCVTDNFSWSRYLLFHSFNNYRVENVKARLVRAYAYVALPLQQKHFSFCYGI